MLPNFEVNLQKYADLLVRVGLNLQPKQRLLIYAPLPSAPLVHQVAACAYQNGARLVDVLYYDDQLLLARFQHGPRESFDEVSPWRARASFEYAQQGDAVLSIAGQDPDLLKDRDPELIKRYTLALGKVMQPYAEEAARFRVPAHRCPSEAAHQYIRRGLPGALIARPGDPRFFCRTWLHLCPYPDHYRQ